MNKCEKDLINLQEFLGSNEEQRDSLRKLISRGRVFHIVGAGFSKKGNSYPLWKELLQLLSNDICQNDIDTSTQELYPREKKETVLKNDLKKAKVLEHASEKKNPGLFRANLKEHFVNDKGIPQKFHLDFVKLPGIGFATTNYDSLIERSLDEVYGSINQEIADCREDGRTVQIRISDKNCQNIKHFLYPSKNDYKCVLHLHGYFQYPRDCILTESDYKRAYGFGSEFNHNDAIKSTEFTNFILSALLTHRLIFWGFSMTDPYFEYMSKISAARQWTINDPKHYVVFGRNISNDIENCTRETIKLRRQGIQPVYFEDEENFKGIENALSYVLEKPITDNPHKSGIEPEERIKGDEKFKPC